MVPAYLILGFPT